MASRSYYDTLGVSETATTEKIREEYLVRSKMFHPDRFDQTRQANEWRLANEMLKDLNQAYNVLRDPRSRSAYDSTLRGRQHAPPPQASPPPQQTHQTSPPPPPPPRERRPPPSNLGPLSSGFAHFAELPEAIRERLRRRVSGENKRQFITSLDGVAWYYVFFFVVLAWFPLLFVFAGNHKWTSDGRLFAYGGSAVAAILAGVYLSRIIRWHRSALRCNFILSPLYFIKTHLDQVWFWPIWKLQDISATHNYRNNIYQGTDVRMVFDTGPESFVFKDRNAYEQAISALKVFDTKVRTSQAQEEYEYFVTEDDFREWNSANPSKPKKGLAPVTIVSTVAALAAAAVATFVAVSINSENFPYQPPARFAELQPVATPRPQATPARAASVPVRPPKPVFNEPAVPSPPSGDTRLYTTQKGLAPLQIRSSPGGNYLVKLDDAVTKRPVLSVFVQGGQTEEVLVPLGTYIVKYASGDEWYGYKHLFGPDTLYSKADEDFTFTREKDHYSGFTVTLYKVENGNLHTTEILPTDF